MVKIIQLEKEYNCDHLLGKYLEDDSYDIVANEDVDVYLPLKLGQIQDEHTILMKFRKNVFTPEQCVNAYNGLRGGATLTDNRGIAAGSERTGAYQMLPNGQGSRRWVTKREKAVLEYFLQGSPASVFGDLAQELYDTTPNTPLEGRGGGSVTEDISIKGGSIWIVKKAHEIDFDVWFRETVVMDSKSRYTRAVTLCDEYISDTTYGEGVYSGVAGSMDRYPRIPFCRQTAWTAAHRDKFEMAFPLMETASQVYGKELPIRWQGQYDAASKLDPHYRISDTVYSTVTINKHFRTACHRDAGDLCEDGTQARPRGFSNLTVLTNGKAFDGFYLCFPEFRIAANIQAGDLIMMNPHRIHGNTPIKSMEDGFERLSIVLYFREGLTECGSRAYEEARREFTYMNKGVKSTNGVFPGMWNTQEWKDFLYSNGLTTDAEQVIVNR